MVSRYVYLSAILAVAAGCDSSFTGEGFGGLGGAQKFRTGDGNPPGYPPGGPGDNPLTQATIHLVAAVVVTVATAL